MRSRAPISRSDVTYTLNFYQDQILGGARAKPLAPAHRMVLVRSGQASAGGAVLGEMRAAYLGESTIIAGEAEWTSLWRWEVVAKDTPPNLLEGSEVFSVLRMSRDITSLDLKPGSDWLFRLDRIKMAAGRVTDPHVHPGPGIRCLLEGTFSADQKSEPVSPRLPGDPWWELGPDEVVARAAPRMRTRFMRGMVLPHQFSDGTETAKWLDSKNPPPSDNWTLFVDQVIRV
jgi:hypothetical protein